MRNFINKNSIAAFMFAAVMSVSSAANASELISPVNIEQVGKMKFLVSAEPNAKLVVIIYDADQNIIHQEVIASKKLYKFRPNLNYKISSKKTKT